MSIDTDLGVLAPPGAFDITGWCAAYNTSKSKLYRLWREGRGPKSHWLDGRRMISFEDARTWFESLPSCEEKIAA